LPFLPLLEISLLLLRLLLERLSLYILVIETIYKKNRSLDPASLVANERPHLRE